MLYKSNNYEEAVKELKMKTSNSHGYNERKYRKEVDAFYQHNKDVPLDEILTDVTERELRALLTLCERYLKFTLSGILFNNEVLRIVENSDSYTKLRNYFI